MSLTLFPVLMAAVFGVLPAFLTEVLAKAGANQATKSVINVILAAGAATAAQFTVAADWNWGQALIQFGIAWVTSLAIHYSGATRPVQKVTARVGLGPTVDFSDLTDPEPRDVQDATEVIESDAPNLARPAT